MRYHLAKPKSFFLILICPPLLKKAHNPITGKAIDFSKSPEAIFRLKFYDEFKK